MTTSSNPRKKRLYLHIGTGKTGSTSVQRFFSSRDNSFYFFCHQDGDRRFVQLERFVELLDAATGYEKIVYSNEWSYWATSESIRLLRDALADDFDVRVILYVRRQDQFELSRYQQVGKAGSHRECDGTKALPERISKDLDYLAIADRWAEFFTVDVRVFDRAYLKDGDIIADFSEAIDEDVSADEPINENQSAGLIEVKLGHLINKLNLNPMRLELLDSVPDSPLSLPSKEEAKRLFERYRDENHMLFEKYVSVASRFSDDFSKYPDQRQDLWTEETAESGMCFLLQKLEHARDFRLARATDLMAIASDMEASNPEVSAELSLIAKRLERNY